jgi:preprotein translocase subunit SecG
LIYALVLGIHLLICIFLVMVVLLQAGKGGGLAGAFGVAGGAAQSLFGGRGAATFLGKATTVLGISFMVSSLLLALMSGHASAPKSVLRGLSEEPGATPPPATTEPLQMPGTEPQAPLGPGSKNPVQSPPPSGAPANQTPATPGQQTPNQQTPKGP